MEIIFVFFATQRYSILQNFIHFEYFSVKFGLPLHRPRIGPRRGGHTPQPHVPPGIFEPDALAYGRFVAPRDRTQRIGGFLAGSDEGAAGRDTRQQGGAPCRISGRRASGNATCRPWPGSLRSATCRFAGSGRRNPSTSGCAWAGSCPASAPGRWPAGKVRGDAVRYS